MSGCPPILQAVLAAPRSAERLMRAASGQRNAAAAPGQRSAAAQAPAPEPVHWTNLADSYAPAPAPIPKPRPRVPQAAPHKPIASGDGCERQVNPTQQPQAGGMPESGTPTSEFGDLADLGDAGKVGASSIGGIAVSGGVGLGTAALLAASSFGAFTGGNGGGNGGGTRVAVPAGGFPSTIGGGGGGTLAPAGPALGANASPTTVPEPASMLMMAVALASLVLMRRWSRRRAG